MTLHFIPIGLYLYGTHTEIQICAGLSTFIYTGTVWFEIIQVREFDLYCLLL